MDHPTAAVALDAYGIKLYGWLDQGASLNSLSPRDRWNGPGET